MNETFHLVSHLSQYSIVQRYFKQFIAQLIGLVICYLQVVPVSSLVAVCKAIVDSGRSYAAKHRSPAPLMYAYYKTEYLGNSCLYICLFLMCRCENNDTFCCCV